VLLSKSFSNSSYTKPAVNALYVIGDTRADERRGRGSRFKLLGLGGLEGGPGPGYVAYVFVFPSSVIICHLYKLTLSDQAQVILQLRVCLSNLMSRFLAGHPLLGV
jgi:hypothetical protein